VRVGETSDESNQETRPKSPTSGALRSIVDFKDVKEFMSEVEKSAEKEPHEKVISPASILVSLGQSPFIAESSATMRQKIIKGCEMTSQRIISAWLRCALGTGWSVRDERPSAYAQAKMGETRAILRNRLRKFGRCKPEARCTCSPASRLSGKPIGMVYEYDPAGNQWTKKKPMALASHHVAFHRVSRENLFAFGGFVFPQSGPPAWVPINNAWEYDPAWGHLESPRAVTNKRGSAVAAVVAIKIYVICGAALLPGSEATALTPSGASSCAGYCSKSTISAANTWRRVGVPMPTPRNHRRCWSRQRKDLRDRRASMARHLLV